MLALANPQRRLKRLLTRDATTNYVYLGVHYETMGILGFCLNTLYPCILWCNLRHLAFDLLPQCQMGDAVHYSRYAKHEKTMAHTKDPRDCTTLHDPQMMSWLRIA